MDYPLAEALLGFCGGSHLDLRVVQSHNEYAAHVRSDGRRGVRR